MKIVKPNWVTHDGSPIFSVDIHPDGKKFATGGQGGDCGRVVIWNMVPVLKEEVENDSKIPKLLCQLDHHLACVNCVRWSSTGLLASAGDDKLVMVWRFIPGVKASSIFGGKAGVETWRCLTTLRSHSGDILDLAWAPFNQWLASASVDNTIIVWDVPNQNIVAVLKGHTGMVKGVTWDPIGKYLASQSDDKSLRVWRTSDWKEETVITEPFEECGGTTHVLRLSWSPDGQYLVSAHAMNGGGPTAQIIERDGWKQDKDYVGHRKAVTCVKFNSNILQKKTSGDKKPVQFCCVAIGSRDRSLSFWSTSLKRPLVVIHELFVSSVLDISWSPCGLLLCACSKDGTTVFVEFSEEELGQPVDSVQKLQLQERLYGKLNKERYTIVEDPEIFLRKKKLEIESAAAKESKSSENKTNCIQNTDTNTITNSNSTSTAKSAPVKAPINRQIETKTSDGKRRITPMFIPLSAEASDKAMPETSQSVPQPSSSSLSSSTQAKSSIIIEKRDEVVQPNVSSIFDFNGSKIVETPGVGSKLPSYQKSHQTNNQTNSNKKATVERHIGAELLSALKPNSSLSMITGHYSATIMRDNSLHHLEVFQGTSTQAIWDQYFGYTPTGLAVSPAIIAISFEDGTVHTFFTAKGGRAAPPFAPPSPISKIHAAGSMLMTISVYGDVRVWEISPYFCRLVVSTSAAHLMTVPDIKLLNCMLLNGMPHLAFTNCKGYIFHKEMGTWLLVGDSEDPVFRWSAVTATETIDGASKKQRGPLAIIQEGLNRYSSYNPHPNMPHSLHCIFSYLEQQVLSSKALGSSKEYVSWLLSLINFMCVHDGLESRLRVILDELLGPSHSTAHITSKSVWDPVILGMKKHKLLEDILKVIANHIRLQRLYLEYKEQLEELKKLWKENTEQ